MFFGYITDKKTRIEYSDPDTHQVVFRFKSRERWQNWLQTFPDKKILAELDLKVFEVPWFEDNFELAKLCLPVVLFLFAVFGYF